LNILFMKGHYYVVDSAYPCMRGFLPPYKG